MSNVESLYQNAVDSMTPCEKIARSIGLFNWSREFVGREIQAANPNASSERLKLLVALRIYGGDARTSALVEGLLANVSEWCNDWQPGYKGLRELRLIDPNNHRSGPVGPEWAKARKGASWADPIYRLFSSNHSEGMAHVIQASRIGFRVVRNRK